jgi:hypothetical protein
LKEQLKNMKNCKILIASALAFLNQAQSFSSSFSFGRKFDFQLAATTLKKTIDSTAGFNPKLVKESQFQRLKYNPVNR